MYRQTRNISATRRRRGSGFSLIEIMAVIGIIAALAALLGLVLGPVLTGAKEKATAATITKINGLLRDRADAFNRALENTDTVEMSEILQAHWRSNGRFVSRDILEVMVKKALYAGSFPQREEDFWGPNGVDDGGGGDDHPAYAKFLKYYNAQSNGGATNPNTRSSALLYWALTKSDVYGAPPEGIDNFNSRELADTDEDGLLEFVDAWGKPLRFYRWPTRLIRPAGYSISGTPPVASAIPDDARTICSLLMADLPPPRQAMSDIDPLTQDPSDPNGTIERFIRAIQFSEDAATATAAAGQFETLLHTVGTYHLPLVVSLGVDGQLGLYEPHDGTNFGNLANPVLPRTSSGNTGAVDWPAVNSSFGDSPLLDNITNQNLNR